jgi:hypothetical protein
VVKFPDARIIQFINGTETVAAHGTRDMPIWGQAFHSLDRQDKGLDQLRISNLVDYLKSIQAK